jgi:hypothetical protein
MRTPSERTEICNFLGRRGLATLDDPRGMVQQIGFLVRDHDHFRSLLVRCEPEERRVMYESLKPHLRFGAKPLDVYIAEAQRDAEARQLPTVDEHGNFQPFKVGEIRTEDADDETLENHVEQKIEDLETAQKAVNEALAKKTLILVCAKCTKEESFPGAFRTDCWVAARRAGWHYQLTSEGGIEICPDCPKSDLRPKVA